MDGPWFSGTAHGNGRETSPIYSFDYGPCNTLPWDTKEATIISQPTMEIRSRQVPNF